MLCFHLTTGKELYKGIFFHFGWLLTMLIQLFSSFGFNFSPYSCICSWCICFSFFSHHLDCSQLGLCWMETLLCSKFFVMMFTSWISSRMNPTPADLFQVHHTHPWLLYLEDRLRLC